MKKSEGWERYLHDGERIVWQGQPDRRIFIFRPAELMLIPFSAIWFGFVIYIASAAPLTAEPSSAVLILFMLVGVYFLIGRFFVDRYIRTRTSYALTEKRALILASAFKTRLRELPIPQTLQVGFDDAPRGSVRLGPQPEGSFMSNGLAVWHSDDGSFTFGEIENPKSVYDLVQEIKGWNE
ncbi:MAG: hypothetical protein AAFR53_14155 [Pseudomonadota bacterium]